ncbi:MAG: hypothetical protein IJH07_07535 [Ruminococcus sp.]|nr:hypothetical protein [Ruminococcus sp.]
MNNIYENMPNGYRDTIEKGLSAVKYFYQGTSRDFLSMDESVIKLKEAVAHAEAIVIGAGAGLSTAAGLTYSGERFEKYFYDFARRFKIRDMYSGGFYPFPDKETFWAWWARHIYYNRYIDAPKSVYSNLLKLVEGKDYFVITTNVDHQFQKAGFDKKRLFYTQGDYGLFQSVNRKIKKTYDNENWVMKAMDAQGFVKDENGVYQPPENGELRMRIPTEMIPKCPDDNSDMTLNLRSDDSFVEDEGWHRASAAYADFLRRHEDLRVLYFEIGVGANTPVIVKYPFWQMTLKNDNATYACLNYNEAFCPVEIQIQSICINGDANEIIKELL